MTKPLSRIVAPLARGLRAFFQHDVALRREEGRVQLVLEERTEGPKKPRPPSAKELERQRDKRMVEQMREDLANVLDAEPGSRSVLRHLAFMDYALEKKGLKAFRKVPLDVLQHAHHQLEALVTNWSPEGLACLRSKMAVAIIERERTEPGAAPATSTLPAPEPSPRELAVQAIESARQPAAALPAADAGEDDGAALAAAYAALGALAPGGIEVQGELGSRSAKVLQREASRQTAPDSTIEFRAL